MPSSVVQMIRSGEDSGNMAEVLRDVSAFYGRELKTVIKTVTSMIEPIMIVLHGLPGRLHRHEHHSADLQDVEPGHGQVKASGKCDV